jgi:hypothetical protein
MKYCLIPILLFFSLKNLRAQHIGINLRFGAEKEFEIGKKIELEVEQQLQLSPEVTEVEDKYGSLFNEIYLFPDDDEEDNDDDDGQAEPDDPDNALNDNPIAIDANF